MLAAGANAASTDVHSCRLLHRHGTVSHHTDFYAAAVADGSQRVPGAVTPRCDLLGGLHLPSVKSVPITLALAAGIAGTYVAALGPHERSEKLP